MLGCAFHIVWPLGSFRASPFGVRSTFDPVWTGLLVFACQTMVCLGILAYQIASKKVFVLLILQNPKANSPEGEIHESSPPVAESDELRVMLEAANTGRKAKRERKRRLELAG